MPLYSWLLSSLLVGQIGGTPSAGVTATPPTTIPQIPALPAATHPPTPSNEGQAIREPATPLQATTPELVTHPSSLNLRPSEAAPRRATTPQLVADALNLPPGGTINGRPVSLASVVATVPDRLRQIEAVHAYWRLAAALGEYHFAHERQQRLSQLRAGTSETADLRTAQAIAAAQMREAEVQVTTAQHDLAEILLLVPGTPLPLPADQPLVGPYRTLFAELFAGKNAPQRARTLDQTLPLRNRAVESHAAALLAAEDALDAAIELQASGREPLTGVLSALDAQGRQQRAFLAAVCRYNHDIADYALVVVSPQTSPEILVGTLIKLKPDAGTMSGTTYSWSWSARNSSAPLPTTATLPAAYQQPVIPPTSSSVGVPPAYGSVGVPPAMRNWPTRAVRPGETAGQAPQTATAVQAQEAAAAAAAPVGNGLHAVPDDSSSGIGIPPAAPVVAPPNSPRNDELQEPQLAPPQESAIPLDPEKPAGPTPHTSQKPISASGPSQTSALETYPGTTPVERTAKLTAALFGVGHLEQGAGSTASVLLPAPRSSLPAPTLRLIDCLRTAPADGRVKAIEAYWNARQIAAQHQSFVEQRHWLEALRPRLSAENPPLPMAMLRLRTARLTVEAERADAEADWPEAQFELAGLAALAMEKPLPQPVTMPFVGRLPLPASGGAGVPSASSDRTWSQRRLEATIPQREQAIVDQAAVVVEAEALRTEATADFLAGRSSIERVLAGIEVQARETAAFLRAVTEYNRAIAQYATATLPPNTAAEKLVAALMVE